MVLLQNNLSPQTQEIVAAQVHSKWIMVLGEGFVFLIILLLAANIIRKSFNREKSISIQQKNFLLSVTHELKSPLASIRLQLETLIKRTLTKEQEKQILNNAISETERLNNLVENILTASRIDQHTFNIERKRENLSEFLESSIEAFKKEFPVRQFESAISQNIFYTFDKTWFSLVIHNLLENACKYSPDDVSIGVSLNQQNDKILLKVTDQGIGIPEPERSFIFNKFYRLQNEETRSTKGTGLGLFITKFLIEKHSGSIKVESNKPQGSVFIITLPKNE